MSLAIALHAFLWQTAGFQVGSAAPPIAVEEWLTAEPSRAANTDAQLVLFLDVDADTRHSEWQRVRELAGVLGARGTVTLICDAPREAAREYHQSLQTEWPENVALARDPSDRTRRTYCDPVGVAYVPYLFVLDGRGTLAWHGHPLSTNVAEIIKALLAGTYDAERARALIRSERTADRLRVMFEQAFARQRWDVALTLIDELLATEAPKPQLLRHKLALLMGPLRRTADAERLVTAIVERYAKDADLLNTLAWDLLSQPEAFRRSPRSAIHLARAALQASDGDNAQVLDTYALAMYRIGALDEAVTHQRQAVEHASEQERSAFAGTLTFYEQCAALRASVMESP